MKATTWAAAGMGEGPRMGPPVPAVGRLFPPTGLEGKGASGVIRVQCRAVMGPEMTSSPFCPVLPFTSEAKGATQGTLEVQAAGSPGEYNTAQKRAC